MSDNRAAFCDGVLRGKDGSVRPRPLRVAAAQDQFPEEEEIVIRNAAISLNPVDWELQYDKFPQVQGTDVAGEVVDVGIDVERFKVGDRVLGHALALATHDNRHGGFQRYTVVQESMAAHIPESLSFQKAATLPLGVSTAAAALFQPEFMGLAPPKSPRGVLPDPSETVIIGAAAGNVGSNAVQLAVAAGYNVVATAALAEATRIEAFGPAGVVKVVEDRKGTEEEIRRNIKAAVGDRKLAGIFDTAGKPQTMKRAVDLAGQLAGRKIAVTTWSFWDLKEAKEIPPGVKAGDVIAVAIRNNEIGGTVYKFLGEALEANAYKIAEPEVSGTGLNTIQPLLSDKPPKGKKVILLE